MSHDAVVHHWFSSTALLVMAFNLETIIVFFVISYESLKSRKMTVAYGRDMSKGLKFHLSNLNNGKEPLQDQ